MNVQGMKLGSDDNTNFRALVSGNHDSCVDNPLSDWNKLRLLMLYAITHPTAFKDERLKMSLVQMSGLNSPDHSYALCGAELMAKEFGANAMIQGRISKKNRGGNNAYNKYTPLVKDVAEKLMAGALPIAEYPYMREAPGGNVAMAGGKSAGGAAKAGGTARSQRTQPKWANKTKGAAAGGAAGAKAEKKAKVIIFVVGGMSHSEMRCAYEATKAQTGNRMPVLLGSTSILHPSCSHDRNGAPVGGAYTGCPEFMKMLMDVWQPGK